MQHYLGAIRWEGYWRNRATALFCALLCCPFESFHIICGSVHIVMRQSEVERNIVVHRTN